MKKDELIGGNHDINLPQEIDSMDRKIIGSTMFISSFRLTQGAISVGPHIVVSENRIE